MQNSLVSSNKWSKARFIFFGGKKMTTKKITMLATLAALAVVLKMVVIYFTGGNRLVFHNIPIMISGMIFGPFWGVITAGIADGTSAIYTPGWSIVFFFPQLLWGLIPGLMKLFFKKWNIKTLVLIEVFTHLCVSIANTFALSYYMKSWDFALGKVSSPVRFRFEPAFLDWRFQIFEIGEFIYVRLILVLIIMLIKIPIDVFIINILAKRVLEENFVLNEVQKEVVAV